MVFALLYEVVIALHACIRLQEHRSSGPESLPWSTHGEVATKNELAQDGADLHSRGFIILQGQDFEMSSVDASSLFKEVAQVERSLIVDNTGWLVELDR